MVARWNRTVQKNSLSDVDVASAMKAVRSIPKDSKGKKKLGTARQIASTRSVSSRTTKTNLSTSKSIKSVRSTPKDSKGKTKLGTARQISSTRSVSSRKIKTKPPTPRSIKSTAGTPKSGKAKKKLEIAHQLAMGKMTDPQEWDPTMPPPTPRQLDRQPSGIAFVKPDIEIITSYADTTEAEKPVNPSSPTSVPPVPAKTPSSMMTDVEVFEESSQPHPASTTLGVLEPTPNGRLGSFADSESEGANFSEYTFFTEDGTEYKIDEVTFDMFLGDVKGYVVDKSGKMIPTGPELVEFLRKTKEKAKDAASAAHDIVPESVKNNIKNNINHTARVLDPRDISGGELLASAKEIGTVTKDVVVVPLVEETVGCAAWSFGEILASLKNFSEKEHVKAEADELVVDPVAVEGLFPADEQMLAGKGLPTVTEEPEKVSMVTGEPVSNPSGKDPIHHAGFSANYNTSNEEDILEHVSIEASIKERKKSFDDQNLGYLASPSKAMSTMTDEATVDMKEHLRQIKDLNAQVEILLSRGDPADVDLAVVLKHRSKVLCKNMAVASSRAANKTGKAITRAADLTSKAAVRTSKAVGQTSSSVAKSSKKGLGSALLSTSKAMGSLGEKLAKSTDDDATSTTGDTSPLSGRSRSRSSQMGTSENVVYVSL